MRQKRAKAYRKQMSYYQMNFKFREPYQLLVDDEIILESCRIKVDLQKALERTIQGQVKPMITQCCMEALYRSENQQAIALGKSFERRRCGHRPAPKGRAAIAAAAAAAAASGEASKDGESKEVDKDGPRKPHDCLWEVIVHNNQNQHRYVVATQKDKLRNRLRRIPAVPMLYLSRSVMIMEPMSPITERARALIEVKKLTQGLNDPQTALKNKTSRGSDADNSDEEGLEEKDGEQKQKKKAKSGPKQPNPLSMKKKKKEPTNAANGKEQKKLPNVIDSEEQEQNGQKKQRRRRKHHGGAPKEESKEDTGNSEETASTTKQVEVADASLPEPMEE